MTKPKSTKEKVRDKLVNLLEEHKFHTYAEKPFFNSKSRKYNVYYEKSYNEGRMEEHFTLYLNYFILFCF